MSNKKSVILGAGTYGEVYLAYLRDAGIEPVAFLDDAPEKVGVNVGGIPVVGGMSKLEMLRGEGLSSAYAPIGNNTVRRSLLARARAAGFETPGFIHDSVLVAPQVKIGAAVYILPGSIIMPYALIADDAMISMAVKVAHHTSVGCGVFLSTNTSIGADIAIEENAYLGMSVTAVTGKCKVIGRSAVIGACSNVLSDVPPDAIFVGNPARPLKQA